MVRDQDFVMHPNPKAKIIAKTLFEDFSNDTITEESKFEPAHLEISDHVKEFEEYNRCLDVKGLDYIEINMPLHSDAEDLNATVRNIKHFLEIESNNNLGILVHHLAFNQISHHFNIEKVVKFTSSRRVLQKLPELIYGSFVDQPERKILVMKGMIIHQELLDTTARTIPTRILRKLGVDKFVIIGNVFAANSSMKIGDVVIPTDHINFSILNPTMGKNINEWGRRFYDVSK